jgi:predicted anti-sigma-YlaC factor YlaD
MACDREKIVFLLIDDELSDHEAKQARAHLAECAQCRTVFDRLTELNHTIVETRPLVSAGLAVKIKDRISARARPDRASVFIPRRAFAPMLAGIIVLAAYLGNMAGGAMTQIITRQSADVDVSLVASFTSPSLADALIDLSEGDSRR